MEERKGRGQTLVRRRIEFLILTICLPLCAVGAEVVKSAHNEMSYVELGLFLATVALAIYTFKLWQATVSVADAARDAASEQAQLSIKNIEVATATMNAMQEVADATKNNAVLMSGMLAKQMRAFLAVDFGGATYQEKNLRFGGAVSLNNVGMTPAKNVGWWVVARVTMHDKPDLTKPAAVEFLNTDLTINPRQDFRLQAVVADSYADDLVVEIMSGVGNRKLFLFGEVVYDDIYGVHHTAKFCHVYHWWLTPKEEYRWSGHIFKEHNSSD